MMSAVVYDVGYDTRMIKTRKNMVTVRFLAAIKEKKLRKTCIDRSKNIKISKHTAIFKLSISQPTSYDTADDLISNHSIKPFLESFLSFYI